VPVFLLFSSELLTRAGVRYTNGNFAAQGPGIQVGDSADFLAQLDFRRIYHDGAILSTDPPRHEITFSRHAEVLVADELNFELLEAVVCRSGAERLTLLSLLGEEREPWESRIRLQTLGENLFYEQKGFVKEIKIVDNRILVYSKPTRGPFDVHVRVTDLETGNVLIDRGRQLEQLSSLLAIHLTTAVEQVLVELRVDGALVALVPVSRRSVF
jgi:hypothetical protein